MRPSAQFALGCCFAWVVAARAAEDAPKKTRAISPHLAEVFASKLPVYAPPPPRVPVPASTSPLLKTVAAPGDAVDPNIVQLPRFIVRENQLPGAEEVLTDTGRAQLAMERYLGPENALDRGFLNRFTIGEYWKKIPLIGKVVKTPFWLTNEERALVYYKQDKEVRKREEMRELGRLLRIREPAPQK
jgi:hypothetical protein